jgi:hypothetical protein
MKALSLEEKQEWIGVSIDESIEENFSNFLNSPLVLPTRI